MFEYQRSDAVVARRNICEYIGKLLSTFSNVHKRSVNPFEIFVREVSFCLLRFIVLSPLQRIRDLINHKAE